MSRQVNELLVAQGGLRVPASAATGKLAQSDSAGNISWVAPNTVVRAVQSSAYAATVTPVLPSSSTDAVVTVAALTGAITIANPTGIPSDGQNLKINMSQDATGGRTVSWGTAYAFGTDVTAALIPSTASAKWTMLFSYDATSSLWRALAIARGF